MTQGPRVCLISLETWDGVWRRNQHLASQLVRQGLVGQVLFVTPATHSSILSWMPQPRITVISPRRRTPRRLGGTQLVAAGLRPLLAGVDVLWVNDPVLGAACLLPGLPVLYDVTDDWRTAPGPPRISRRVARAEDRLAVSSRTVVCSRELQQRWKDRYGVDAAVVHNAVDADAWHAVVPRALEGAAPHVGYVGTLHESRLDLALIAALAGDERVGTVHLVGPDALEARTRRWLTSLPRVILHGAVPADDVPSWTVSLDVLISPHVISPFTLSLDAIKSYEFLASGRPVVATPTSGFQHLSGNALTVTGPAGFLDAVHQAATRVDLPIGRQVPSWQERAREFAEELAAARDRPEGR